MEGNLNSNVSSNRPSLALGVNEGVSGILEARTVLATAELKNVQYSLDVDPRVLGSSSEEVEETAE